MKLIVLVISCFLFVCICSAAPFTKNSIVVSCMDASANYFMQEYDIEGRLLQKINYPGSYSCQTCQVTLDSSGLLLVVPISDAATAFYVHTMNSQGQYVDFTKYSTGITYNCATVNGQGVYVAKGNTVSYTTRGATSLVTSNIIGNTAGFVAARTLQAVGSKLYLMASTSALSGPFPAVISPIPTTGTGSYVKIGPSTGLTGTYFFVTPKAIYTTINSIIYKYRFDAQGAISSLTPDYSVTVNTAGGTLVVQNLVVLDIDTTTYVVFRMTQKSSLNTYLVRLTDTGSSFVNQTTLAEGVGSLYFFYVSKSPDITCSDSFKNQDETDIDCGGSTCSVCSNGKTCLGNDDCSSGFCNATNICATPTCNDNAKNQDETDVDCGGPTCSSGCDNDKSCISNDDCLSGFCNGTMICAAPTCNDNAQNQNETDIDCGGPYCPGCANDKMCIAWSDCASGYCNSSSICEDPTCSDQIKNQNEADVDCGGLCEKCVTGKSCLMDEDCLSQKCESLLCVISCLDGIMNQDETDVDCGGSLCSKCANTKNCLNSSDCTSSYCNPNNTCATESCDDNLKNQDETDTDCGGNTCTSRCSVGQSCVMSSDCDSNTCSDNSCVTVPIAPPVAPPVVAPLVNIFVSGADITFVSITVLVVSSVTSVVM